MITLYIPATGQFTAVSGTAISDPILLQANILIELRAMNAILLDAQRGVVNQTVSQYRSDAVNDAVNPVV